MSTSQSPETAAAAEPQWTERQREVLTLLVRGQTNAQIAQELGIGLDGAKWHVSEIITKLGVSSREEAAEYWRARNGLRLRFSRRLRVFVPVGAWAKAIVVVVAVAAIAGGAVLAWGLTSDGGDSCSGLSCGFDHPRTVHLAPDGRVIITDLGTGHDDGRVVAVDLASGNRETLMSGLPSTLQGGEQLDTLAGPSGAAIERQGIATNGTLCVVIGGAHKIGGGFNSLRCSDGKDVDLAKFETIFNPDKLAIASDPYDIASAGAGRWLISDAAGNDVLYLDSNITVAGIFVSASGGPGTAGAGAEPRGLGGVVNGRGDIFLSVALFAGGTGMLSSNGAVIAFSPPAAIPANFPHQIGAIADGKDVYYLSYGSDSTASGGQSDGAIYDGVTGKQLASGLDHPTGFARLPDGRFVICEEAAGRCLIE